MKYQNHIKTNRSVIVMFEDHAPVAVPSENKMYEAICGFLSSGRYDDIPQACSKALRIKKGSDGFFEVIDGQVAVDGETLPNSLSERILEFVEGKLEFHPLLNFWHNLRQNPSETSRQDLYDFLEKNHVPLTEDGCFVCYKKVKSDYFDCWTGKTHKYKPGAIVKMPRSKVDSNRNNTCSTGLHVAGWNYMRVFNGNRIIEVKINPKNVVAVPPDYEFTKIRVCELEILRDCPKYMDEKVQLYNDDEHEIEELDLNCVFCGLDDSECECEEDEETEETEEYEIEEYTIKRLPTHLTILHSSNDGRVRVSTEALNKIGIKSGQSFFAVIPTKRSKCVQLVTEEPDNPHKLKKIVAGTASARLPASLFRHIDSDNYRMSCTQGILEIRFSPLAHWCSR